MKTFKAIGGIFFLLGITISFAQEKEIKLTSEHLKLYTLIQGKVPDFIELHQEEVPLPIWEEGLVVNPKYTELFAKRDNDKGHYDKFIHWRDSIALKKEERAKMVGKIEEFLYTKGKYKEKIYLLIEANEISDKYGFLQEFDASIFRNKAFIYNENKRPDNDFLKAFLKYQEELKNTLRGPGYSYKKKEERDFPEHIRDKFISLEKNLKNTPEYIKGQVLSEITTPKSMLVMTNDKVNESELRGNFNGSSYKNYLFVTIGKSGNNRTVLLTEDNARLLKAEYKDYCSVDDSQLYQVLITPKGDKAFATNDLNIVSYLNKVSELETIPFVFVKSTIDRLNYFAKVRNTGEFSTTLNKKKMTGMYELPDLNTAIDYDVLKYIPFSTINLTEQFVVRTPFKTDSDMDLFMIIQSLKTKKNYVVNNYLFNLFQNYEHMGDKEHGYGYIFKPVPEELTPAENERYTRLMRIVNQGKAKADQIEKVLQKYSLRNMYDVSRISTVDKKAYNKLLQEMKALYKQVNDILNYEDENKKVSHRLTIKEVAKIEQLGHDCTQLFELSL